MDHQHGRHRAPLDSQRRGPFDRPPTRRAEGKRDESARRAGPNGEAPLILIINEYGKDSRELRISRDEIQIGRDPRGDVVFEDPGVSRHHVRILRKGEVYEVEDLGSRNGTLLNEDQLGGRACRTLENGDEIQIGRSVLRFLVVSGRRVTTSALSRSSGVLPTLTEPDGFEDDSPMSLFGLRKLDAYLLVSRPGRSTQRHPITSDRVRIGRRPDSEICLEDPTVSAGHAEIAFNNEGFHIVDRDSRAGTYRNGTKVSVARLAPGDCLRFGRVRALFVVHEEGEEPPLPSFWLRDQLIHAYPEKGNAIQSAFRESRERGLEFGETVVTRGLLDPEAWHLFWNEFGRRSGSGPRHWISRVFRRR